MTHMRAHPLRPNLVLVLACLLAILLFLLGIVVPQAHFWGNFLVPIVLVFLWGRRRDIYLVTTLASLLVVASYWTDGATTLGDFVTYHLLPLIILWGAAWLLAQRQQLQEHLARSQQELEEQVTARTAELKTSEQRYRLIAEHAGDLIWTVDMDGSMTYASPSAQHLRGVTGAEEQSASWFDRMPPEVAAHAAAALQADLAALRAGLPIDATPRAAPAYRKDGTLVWTETVMSPIYDEEGRPLGLCGSTRDITARKQLEARANHLAALVDAAADAITSATVDGTIFTMNRSAEALYGIAAAATVGQNIATITPPELRANLPAAIARNVSGEIITVDDVAWRRPDGDTRILSLSLAPVYDSTGQVTALSAIARDVTTRKAAEREHLFLSALVTSSPDAVVGRTVDGTILSWNRGAEQLFGYTAEEAVGRNLTMLAAPGGHAQLQADMDAVAQGDPVEDVETLRMAKDGRVFDCVVSMFPVRAGGGEILGVASFTRDISRRKAAERALRASEERFARLFDSSPVGLALTRLADGLFREVNAAFAAMIGYSRAEIIGRTSAELGIISPEDRARLAAALQEQGSFQGTDIVLRSRDGELLYTIFSIDLMDLDGEPWLLSSIVDISDRKRLEDQLRDSEERFRLIVQNSPDVIALHDEQGSLVYLSPALEHAYGVTAEMTLAIDPLLQAAIATPPGVEPGADELARLRAHPQFANRRAAAAAVAYCLEHPGVQHRIEFTNTLTSGEVRHFDAAYRAYRRNGGSSWVVTIVREVTESRRAEARLREANQRLQLATDAAGIGIWNWNFADDSLEWDDRMCELYGVTAAERAAGIFYDLWHSRIHPDDLALAEPVHGEPGGSGGRWSGTYRIVLPGGTVRHIQASSATEYATNGTPQRVIGINRDITDQKLYEQLLQDTNAALEERVAARTADLQAALADLQHASGLRDEFMAMISHELRTPLTGVLSLAELLQGQIAGPINTRQAYYVKGIMESGERLLVVINGILSYTYLLSGRMQLDYGSIELGSLLDICATSQKKKAVEKAQTIVLAVEPADLTITSDATAVAEVLKRLLDNAIKFTPEGGRVGLAAHSGRTPGTVDLVVWDTGIGIAAGQLEHILKPFAQADGRLSRSHEGIGMGLAYVDQMVRLLGGTLALESTPGAGSRFTITLPA